LFCVIGPWGVNTHCATEEAAFTGLQFRVNRVLDDDRRRDCRWLRCMPLRFSLIKFGRQCQLKPPLPDDLFQSTLPAWFAKADQSFFPFSARRAWNTSWMMLLSFRGDRAISSEAAATQIQNAG